MLQVAAVAGPWVYINLIKDDPPARLTIDTIPGESTTSIAAADAQGIDGQWNPQPKQRSRHNPGRRTTRVSAHIQSVILFFAP